MRSPISDGWFFIVFTGVMFGSLGLSTKYLTTQGLDPFICAAIPFTITAGLALGWRAQRLVGTPWLEGMAMGAVNASAPALLFNFGFSQMPASVVTIILALGPLFTALTAHFAFHDDRFSVVKIGGLAVSFAGVAVLAGLPSGGGRPALALAATLTGAAISGSSLVWVKRMAVRRQPMSVLPAMMTGAGLLSVLAATVSGNPVWQVEATPGQWTLLVVMGIGGLATFVGSLKAIELNPASRAGLMGYLVPLVGVTGGIVIFNEKLTTSLILGGMLVIAGVAVVGRANRRLTAARFG
ncbi:MAG: DMT family transporter [Acidimicrobiia bacterium]|nr:DMT family transporter [Acidimicrobiia bacterium]